MTKTIDRCVDHASNFDLGLSRCNHSSQTSLIKALNSMIQALCKGIILEPQPLQVIQLAVNNPDTSDGSDAEDDGGKKAALVAAIAANDNITYGTLAMSVRQALASLQDASDLAQEATELADGVAASLAQADGGRRQNQRKADEEWQGAMYRLAGLKVRPIAADGNCLFAAVADAVTGSTTDHADIRRECMQYVRENHERLLPGMKAEAVEGYVKARMRSCKDAEGLQSIFGDHPEIVALQELYKRPIWIYRIGQKALPAPGGIPCKDKRNAPDEDQDGDVPIRLYHCGDPENHYARLVRVSSRVEFTYVDPKDPASPPCAPSTSKPRRRRPAAGRRTTRSRSKPEELLRGLPASHRSRSLAALRPTPSPHHRRLPSAHPPRRRWLASTLHLAPPPASTLPARHAGTQPATPSLAGKHPPLRVPSLAGKPPPLVLLLAGKHPTRHAVAGWQAPSAARAVAGWQAPSPRAAASPPRRRWLASTPPSARRRWLESTLPSCCRWLASTRMDSPRSRFWLAMTHPMPPVAGRAQRPATPHCTHNLGPAQA